MSAHYCHKRIWEQWKSENSGVCPHCGEQIGRIGFREEMLYRGHRLGLCQDQGLKPAPIIVAS